jgi:hypothetical protein
MKQIFIFIFPNCLLTYSTSEKSPLLVLLPDCLRVSWFSTWAGSYFGRNCFLQVLAIKFWIVNCNQAFFLFYYRAHKNTNVLAEEIAVHLFGIWK